MTIPTCPECCPLCDGMVDVVHMSKHLRALHEVAPGEPTIADVPVSKHWLRMAQASLERQDELVEVDAA
jgi:hypothetical protein